MSKGLGKPKAEFGTRQTPVGWTETFNNDLAQRFFPPNRLIALRISMPANFHPRRNLRLCLLPDALWSR